MLNDLLLNPTFDLSQLADRAGVSPRTVRYYIQQGLLPSPESKGPGAHYRNEHLDRLQIIKRLQQDHLPLAEIRRMLEEAEGDPRGMRALLQAPMRSGSSAQEYIRQALRPGPMPARDHTVVMSQASPRISEVQVDYESKQHHRTRSQWERISLATDIELHIRRPLARQQNKQIERLLDAAREIFQEDAR
ncbi:MAG TPA: MerR family transcriptional regulator [Gemmatimonadaceae bacterium]|nr:MerR family transcriptional regulator [Gemmatimonadaceae bacterium]